MNLHLILFLSFSATLLEIANTYLFRDWAYLRWLGVLIVLDTVLGVAKAWKTHELSSLGANKGLIKIIVYSAALIVTNVLQNFTINGQHPAVLDWFAHFALVAMIIRESISVFENIAILNPSILPIWLLPRLKAIEYEIGDKTFEKNDKNRTE